MAGQDHVGRERRSREKPAVEDSSVVDAKNGGPVRPLHIPYPSKNAKLARKIPSRPLKTLCNALQNATHDGTPP